MCSSQPLLPGERVSDDGGEIIVLWPPPKHHAGVIGSRDDLGGVAGSARCDLDLEVDTRDAFDHLNYLTHRETMTVAAIKRRPSLILRGCGQIALFTATRF